MKALLFAMAMLGGAALAEPVSEDAYLHNVARRAYDDPAAMLDELARQWPSGMSPAREAGWLFARGRVLVAAAQTEAADVVAAELAGVPDGVDRSWLLRALIQDRAGRPSGTLAQRALAGLDKRCPPDDEARAIQVLGCDFRATWEALRLVQREQSGQGAVVAATASVTRAVNLARAGGDRHLLALSLGQLAVLLQQQDQPDEARSTLRAALAEAQSDPVAGARVRNQEAFVERRSGNLQGARVALEAALVLAEQADAPRLMAQLRSNLVDAYMHLGLLRQALAAGRLAMPVLQRFKDRLYERSLHHNLAVTHIKLGQFDAARHELGRVAEMPVDPSDLVPRARELRELADTWADAGQYREALSAFHAERALNARANEHNRASALEELRRKYDAAGRQRDLELLARDGQIKDRQLENRRLAQQAGLAIGALLLLSTVLIGITLLRMRRAQAQLRASQQLLRAQSERDPLTDLSNRRHFLAVMDRSARESGLDGFRGALLMIDIDHFKNVNDRHGHAAGDAVILEVSRRIRAAVRTTDLVVRWGGEEFLVYAPELDADDLTQLAARVLNGIGGAPVVTGEGALQVTASIGFASFPLGGTGAGALRLHWEQAVNWADMVLYKAKAEGRNRGVGIVGVEAPDADTLAIILQDFDAACLHGQVQLTQLQGPQA